VKGSLRARRSRIGELLACGSHLSVRDDGW
jgi:hypothetical protein